MEIPRIIHRVWLKGYGEPQTPPSVFNTYWAKWQKLYPHWQFKTWDGSEFDFKFPEYFAASHCHAWKSDLYRYEVLQREGGLYVDADIEPRASIEDVVSRFELFIAKQVWGGVSNAMIGSVAGHKIWDGIWRELRRQGPEYYAQRLTAGNVDKTSQLSGPLFINKPFFYNPDAALIPSGLILTTPHNAEKNPRALNHHHASNHWRSQQAMGEYQKADELEQEISTYQGPGGAGTILSIYFHRMGIKSCSRCKDLAKTMDNEGVDWCDRERVWILNQIAKNAKKSTVPFIRPVAAKMLDMAIARARKMESEVIDASR